MTKALKAEKLKSSTKGNEEVGPVFIALKPDEIGSGLKTIGWEFEASLQFETT
jgi:hypothetical protein